MSPAFGVLRHEYLFNSGNGVDLIDTVAGANGQALDNAIVNISDSRLVLDGAAAYGALPGPTIGINTFSEVSLEMWFAPAASNLNTFTAAAHFGRNGDTSLGEDPTLGYDYLMLQPTRGPGDQGSRGSITARTTEIVDEVETVVTSGTFDSEVGVTDGTLDLADGGIHHVVMTVDATELAYYVDGAQIGTAPLADFGLADVSNEFAYLGRSLYPDPFLEGSIYEFRVFDNALTSAEVTQRFTDGCVDECGATFLEVDRDTGVARFVNDFVDKDIVFYEINSAAGALDPNGWTPIAGTRDLSGDGTIDSNDDWAVVDQTATTLSEQEPLFDGGADDGAPLGEEISLGPLWQQSRFEDLTASITVLNDDFTETVENLSVRFVGNGGEPFSRSDLDVDGDIDADDYGLLLTNHLTELTGTTPFETFPMGDLDGDLDNDFNDFRLFKTDFIAANGAAAFAALTAIPEPGSALLVLLGAAAFASRRQR